MLYNQVFRIKPKVKQRPRMTRTGRAYTPKETLKYEHAIADMYNGPRFDHELLSVKIRLTHDEVELQVEELKTNPKFEMPKKKLRGDIDNYAKAILDALNGVAWSDDSKVVVLYVEKA